MKIEILKFYLFFIKLWKVPIDLNDKKWALEYNKDANFLKKKYYIENPSNDSFLRWKTGLKISI